MTTLSGLLRALPGASRSVRRSIAHVKHRVERLGAGLNPLERTLDSIASFLDDLDAAGLRHGSKLKALVWLIRSSDRYDEFHSFLLDVSEREERLRRLSSTFNPIQRGKYRMLLVGLVSTSARLARLDALLSWLVRHPQALSKRLDHAFSVRGSVRVASRRVRYALLPAGAMLFGDGMEPAIDRVFSLGGRGFRRTVCGFVRDALGSALPEGTLDRYPGPLRIEIVSVSGSESSMTSEHGVKLSINAIDFFEVLFTEDHGALLELIGLSEDAARAPTEAEPRLMRSIKSEAISALEECWRKRALTQEYAGVLAIERLELPNHTGSFSSIEDFVGYADESVGRGVQPYFARNVGLHLAWILLCERFGAYRPIATASIRELAGRKGSDRIMHKLLDELKRWDSRELVHRYALACDELTRAPLISDG